MIDILVSLRIIKVAYQKMMFVKPQKISIGIIKFRKLGFLTSSYSFKQHTGNLNTREITYYYQTTKIL